MSSPRPNKPAYPALNPYQEEHLQVSDIHQLYIAQFGNPAGIPVVVCHGGPGAGCPSFYAQYFDPQIYRIILFDQRGCGKSTPKFSLDDNTTARTLEDMEKIRQHLKIDQWVVQGGSWGSTLALLYGEKNTAHTLALILRGVFLGREQDIAEPYAENSAASKLHSNEWAAFKKETYALLKDAGLEQYADQPLIEQHYQLLMQDNKEIQKKSATIFANWESLIACLDCQPQPAGSVTDDDVNRGRMEIYYARHKLFMTANEVLDGLEALKKARMPIYIAQGMYDLVCPPYQADILENSLNTVKRFKTLAGHSGTDPGNVSALVEASDQLALQLQLAKEKKLAVAISSHPNAFYQAFSSATAALTAMFYSSHSNKP